jgi:hypothetical protein
MHVHLYLVNESLLLIRVVSFFKRIFRTPEDEESGEPICFSEKAFRHQFFNIIDSIKLLAVNYLCLIGNASIIGLTDYGN